MIEYKILGFTEAYPLVKDLLLADYEEIDERAKTTALSIAEKSYKAMESVGVHFVVVALDGEKTVGYNSMIVVEHPHTQTLTGSNDALYVIPEYRGNGVAKELIAACTEEVKSRGADKILYTFKNNYPHTEMLNDLGYELTEITYSKAL